MSDSNSSPPPGPSNWDADDLADRMDDVMQGLEAFRLEVLAKRGKGWGMLGIAFLCSVLAGVLLGAIEPPLFFVGVVGFVIAGVIIHYKFFGSLAATYRSRYKHEVITGMVKAVSPGMDYQPAGGLAEETFNASGLYSGPDRYHSEDLFAGRIGETEIMFSEVHAEERRTRRDSKGRSETYYVTIFNGILLVADFHKHFRSELAVLPDVAEKNFGWFGRKLQSLGGNLQRMENPDFEKAFVVRGKDAVEARYILTPDMQERLLALRARLNDGVRFAFKQSNVFIGFSNERNWFEGDLKRPAHDRVQMRAILGQMACCFNIVQDLNLNTRIWTKD